MKELYSIDLKDLQSVSVTCKCGIKITVPVKDLAKARNLICPYCETLLGRNADTQFFLGRFAEALVDVQKSEQQFSLEVERPQDKATQ